MKHLSSGHTSEVHYKRMVVTLCGVLVPSKNITSADSLSPWVPQEPGLCLSCARVASCK